MRVLVTGGAGFIGSHLCTSLVKNGFRSIILDNFSAGSEDNIRHILSSSPDKVKVLKGDCTNPVHVKKALKDVEIVFHLAANPEVRLELNNPKKCFKQNIYATHVLLQQVRINPQVTTVIFLSTSTIYGEPEVIPTPEDYAPLKPISLYGASKLASESLISAYAYTYDKKAVILRLANIIGPQSQHGVIYDFVKKLQKNPQQLEILGDGRQTKSYLYITDCIKAIETALKITKDRVEIFNIGSEDQISVADIAQIVTEELGLTDVKFAYTGGIDGGR
ncbi:MAG: NAD-dependent epimerase/dehydratase family protein, partial [Candidatus Bathyarchaeota archaeon]